jgi:hypothetical protein
MIDMHRLTDLQDLLVKEVSRELDRRLTPLEREIADLKIKLQARLYVDPPQDLVGAVADLQIKFETMVKRNRDSFEGLRGQVANTKLPKKPVADEDDPLTDLRKDVAKFKLIKSRSDKL